jgi:hypothetical protein
MAKLSSEISIARLMQNDINAKCANAFALNGD